MRPVRFSGVAGLLCLALSWTGALAAPALPGSANPEPESRLPLPDLKDQAAGMRDLLYRQAMNYLLRYHKDDLGQAVRLFNQILKSHRDFAPAYGGLAEARALRYLWGWEPDPDRLKQAVAQGKKGVELGPELSATHLGLGMAYMASEKYTPALSEFERAVELEPESFRAHLYRGMLLRGLRRTGELAGEVTRVVELDPSSAVAYSLLGDYYQDARKYWSARESYLAASILDQDLLWPRLGLAAAYQKDLNFGAAAKTYDATIRDFPDERMRCRIMSASLLVATQTYEDALRFYEELSGKEELSPPLLRRLILAGHAYSLEKLGSAEKAEYYWTQLVDEFPEDFDGAVRDREVVSQGYDGLVRYYDSKGDSKRSTALLERACRQEGMEFFLYRSLAERRRAAGDAPGAVALLLKGFRTPGREVDLVTASGTILSVTRALVTSRSPKAARQEANSLLDEAGARLAGAPPASYVPFLNLARSEALLGRDAEAVALLRTALDKGAPAVAELASDPDFRTLQGNADFRALTSRR